MLLDNIDVNKFYFLKKKHMVKKAHLSTSLDIMMMMMSLDHYVSSFLKWLDMLNALIIKRQCLLRLVTTKY